MPENNQVAPAVADGAGGDQPAGPGVAQGGWAMVKSLAYRMMIIYFVSSLVRNWRGSPPPQNHTATVDGKVGPPSTAAAPSMNMFRKNQEFDLYVYLSPLEERFSNFADNSALFWKEEGLVYGDWTSGPNKDGTYTQAKTFPCPSQLQNNGSLYMHVFIVKSGHSPDPQSRNHMKRETIHRSRRINKFKKKHYRKTQNLLTGHTEASEEDQKKAEVMSHEILSHWHPNLTLNLIDDQTAWQKGMLPSPLDEAVHFDPVTNDYYPIFFFNDYWNLGSEYMPLNDTVTELNLTLTYSPMSLFKWQLYASQQMRGKWSQVMGGELFEENEDDQDSIKQAILETNPYLLGITVIVSLLHTVFEFLAFKNDIQFWRSRKSLEGLSVRSVLFSVFTSLIVFLYICDNDTNFVVKCSVFVGLLIELWKVPKCMNVSIDRSRPLLGVIPRIVIADKGSYVESATKQHDQMAFKYLSWLLYPLLAGYAVYSLIYMEQKGWYSWVLNMLYGFLLMFGFIMMTPQLFINYKLKSVAHLPWRMLSYKFINTFIDDLFAFVIRMPTMYRIGCFRDDIVFLVYLYQRWIYRVDPNRVNEFGTSGADPTGAAQAEIENQENENAERSTDEPLAVEANGSAEEDNAEDASAAEESADESETKKDK
uniref:Cleft lip and palate associated transmembrane protein n=1 Tax=Plectus sambesii TaxID=2011161 RepID=A0A914VCG2_9BILA